MAVTSTTYPNAVEQIFNGGIDLDTDTLKVALVDDSVSFDSADTVFGDVSSGEVSGTGYTTGGSTLSAVTVTEDDGVVTVGANDVTWTGSTLSAYGAVVYADLATKHLIAFIDFGDEVSTSTEDFVLDFGDGVLAATVVGA